MLQAAKRGGGAVGRGRGRKKSGGEDDMDPGTGSIFDVVKGGRSSLQVIMIIMYWANNKILSI